MTPMEADGRVNVALIPSVEERNLSRATMEAVKRFFEVPQNRAAFERWQKRQTKSK